MCQSWMQCWKVKSNARNEGKKSKKRELKPKEVEGKYLNAWQTVAIHKRHEEMSLFFEQPAAPAAARMRGGNGQKQKPRCVFSHGL